MAGVADANEGLVRIDDGHCVTESVSVLLEVVGGHAPPQVGVRA